MSNKVWGVRVYKTYDVCAECAPTPEEAVDKIELIHTASPVQRA
jgi:hypothetical protein